MARKENRTYPQYAEMMLPFGCDPPSMHCPICGQCTMDEDPEGMKDFEDKLTPCRHVAFFYSGACCDFIYRSEDCQARFDKANLEDIDCDDVKEMLTVAGYGNSLLAIEIIHGGMACGPVWFNHVWGFDYATLDQEEVPSGT